MLNGKQLKIIGSSFIILSCGLTSVAVFADAKPSGAPLKPTVQIASTSSNSSSNNTPIGSTPTPASSDSSGFGTVVSPTPTPVNNYNPPPVSSYGS